MTNPFNTTERFTGNGAHYQAGGIAPLRQDQAQHVYLEKKLMYAEMDRQQHVQSLQLALARVLRVAVVTPCTAVLNWLHAHVHQSAAVSPRV